MAFEDRGYEVVTASSGSECLSKLEGEDPDLVLLDIMMPKMSGWETFEKIQRIKPDTDVIFLSMLEKSPSRKSEGFLGHVIKGDKDEMVQRVEELVEES